MKKYFYTPVLVVLLTSLMTVRAQDRKEYLGLPGDNLNLFAVMDLFQDSETLEGFERNLNDQNTLINNLDLNSDGYVDYIRVIDNVERNVHFIVLQVAVSPRETQDVAVFTVVQSANGEVQVQLVGDEALYGRDYIVEPIYDETPNPGYTGRRVNGGRVNVVHTTTYEISAWPVIRFIYMPTYSVWHSPWRWDYYPSYWRPWNPFYYHYYYGYHSNYYSYYYGHYRHWNHNRYDNWHNSYYSHYRTHSPYVHTRINEGRYKSTYSKPELRREGTALYHRTRQTDSNTGVSSGGRRTSSGAGPNYSGMRQSTESGTRTSAGANTRNSNSSGTRTSAGTNTRQSSGSSTRTSTNTNTRQSSGTRATTNTPARESSGNRESTGTRSNTRSSGTTTKSTGTSTGRSSGSRETTGTSSGQSSTRSSSGQSTSRSSSQTKDSGSSSDSGRRSGSSKSGGQEKSTTKSSGTDRNSGRR